MLSKGLTLFFAASIGFVYPEFYGLSGPPNFTYRKFFHCVEGPTSINLNITPKWINKTHQVLDGDVITSIPVGDNINIKVASYISVEERWMHLSNLTCKFCPFLLNYLGPVRKVVLAACGLSENTCPIPAVCKRTYHSRNVYADMKKSRIPMFPYGLFKIHMAFHNVANNAIEACLGILMENKPLE